MLEKFKRHCNNPITWGKYYKLCGISMLLSAIFSLVWWVAICQSFKGTYTYTPHEVDESEEEES